MKVLITCPPMLRAIDQLRYIFDEKGIELVTPNVVQILSEEELIEIVPTVDAWIIGDDPATEKVFTAGKNGKLRVAVKWGVGVDNVDFKACEKLGIPISNTPRMFGNEVADMALAYFTGLARESYRVDREVRAGNWIKPAGMSLDGKTVALIGIGDIGLATARRLKAFGVKVNAYDPFTKLTAAEANVDEILAFPDKLEQADFVLLTCALTPSNFHLINAESIAKMKDGVIVINVSRGGLIDETALTAALTSGKVRSAGLDVFETEPLPIDSPLRSFEQCILGTHNGSNTREAVIRASLKAIDLLFGFLEIK
ncbi:phosphoglycerate dehydrogenase [Mucilaginibacter sp. X5P1]|uniref:phosphoglycerate dehydrogenase n=1 Tax=Mucilaginibacter sp. X5P1 TaxID=2723088 RepID=UPI001613C05D|nr:phosphoglycerate dehydrogenase [Mucilaginibacter sp. X5P1]MBB6141208.1 D-3-phosphoglycerate dehydrogenase [Mucilaginibacter sp. X5P1]